jgi:transcription antitermination factor NusG
MTLFGAAVSTFTAPWHVCNVRSNEEKAFVSDLRTREVPFFAPWEILHKKDKWWKKRTVQRAVFPGYVFVAGGIPEMDRAARCRGYYGQIIVHDCQQPKLRRELDELYGVLLTDPVITRPIEKGTLVEIKSGPLRGKVGPVITHASGMQLVLQVSILGQSIAVEIDPSAVEAA